MVSTDHKKKIKKKHFSGLKKLENQINFLRSVPLLSSLHPTIIAKLADVLEPVMTIIMIIIVIIINMDQETFVRGEYIIREGTSGDSFYLLADGEVRCLVSITNLCYLHIVLI